MKILYFSRDYTTHDRRFLTELAKTEHQVYYLRLEQRGHALENQPLPEAVQAVKWAGGRHPARVIQYPQLLASLRQVVRKVQPDLIQAGPIQSCALLAVMSGFHPLVSTSWGSDLLLDADRNDWTRWATRFVMNHSDSLIGDCDPVRQKAVEYGMDNERIVTFPWGIDLNHFQPCQFPPEGNHAFTLLSTRSWEPVYGVEVIGRAFAKATRLVKRDASLGSQIDLRLIMLGNGSQAGRLREIFTQEGILNAVNFPGQISQSELPKLYCQADLYLAASYSDGTSISLLEAMACGKPVLVSDIPGNREWVTPEKNGWLFPAGDEDALARGILAAVQQRKRLLEMGQAARSLAEQRADWQENFKCLLDAYQVAVHHHKRKVLSQ